MHFTIYAPLPLKRPKTKYGQDGPNSFIQEAENVQMLTHAYVRKHIATGHRSDSGDPRIFFHLTEIVTIVHATTIDLQVNYDAEITGIVLPFAR